MKKILLALIKRWIMRKIILVILCLVFCSNVYANSPKKIGIEFDNQTKRVSITVTHPVEDPMSHFVKKIKLSLNRNTIVEKDFNRQQNRRSQILVYTIPSIKLGDVISVEASCNKTGELFKEITIEEKY
ncbi:MAG: hypothetical protein KKH80_01085 [Candidatus Omnitrophica bacterium]|nr:hypothetical protein [Candidatus Omnitrophota bacterium]